MADPPPLQTPLQFVRGVGPQRAELLERLGLQTVEDLLLSLPRDVLDLTHVVPASALTEGKLQTVRGTVVDIDGRMSSSGKPISAVLIESEDGTYARGVWFNQPWVLQRFHHDETVLFSGKPKRNAGRWEMSHPRIQWLNGEDEAAHGGVLPLYRLTEGLKIHDMRRIARTVVEEYAGLVPDPLPEELRGRCRLPAMGDALRAAHLPLSVDQFREGCRRLIFQDLLEFQLALALRRRQWRSQSDVPRFPLTTKIDSRIRRLLSFDLTAGQNQVLQEITADLASGWSMHRLLQADVGAGKTVVAIYAMLVTVAAGYQAVLMAPTELLASQHWQTVERLLGHSRVRRLYLTGQLSAAERQKALQGIREGTIDLVVGTQAIVQKDVSFGRLGLLVVDEQHKFGVLQRAHFSSGGDPPHTLVMTATPIPRTLCLTQFGDLDLSMITELPPGRQKVVTSRILGDGARQKMFDFVRQKLGSGRQVYIVCPRITGNTDGESSEELSGAEQIHRQLAANELQGFRVGLLHGQLDTAVKARVMEQFRQGELQVLVATTVVEVGVDVPNATLMVIYSAESFGLSQLHQLRGRIRRGRFQGYCFLLTQTDNAEALSRLQVLEAQADGFAVAEADFQIRGPGDVLGTRQHGNLPLKVADLLRDADVLEEARQVAFDLVRTAEFDQPEYAPLKIQVLERFGQLFDLAGSG